MKTGLRVLFFCFDAPIILCSVLLLLMIEAQPMVNIPYPIDKTEIQAVKTMFRSVHNRPKTIKSLIFTEKSLNNIANYFLKRYLQTALKIGLTTNELEIKIALELPKNNWGKYFNIAFKLNIEPHKKISIDELTFGKIQIANELSQSVLAFLLQSDKGQNLYNVLEKTVKHIDITTNKLVVKCDFKVFTYTDFIISLLTEDQQSLWWYEQGLDRAIKAHDVKVRLSLKELLQPLFELAQARSSLQTAIAENKRVIMTVSRYVNSTKSEHEAVSNTKFYPTFLYKRTDIAKHFMTSALITVIGTSSIAKLLGQEKEFRDAKIGSGFSFIDLAGDRAGIYFGKILTKDAESARRLQQRMAVIKDYHAFMPDIRDLPEKITNDEFERRFGTVDSPEYVLILNEIDRRITQLPIYAKE
jgi:hypothetical protein